ncbi:bifunctional DNA-formamidopyrimidine glycosylase/DNA-(apurinic or apyrimidinic site) lyase [Humibacter albus]|uniref:bifunctional DNA-formamidopyrimidine glycosylase/DNA-(apurinic or apyrimidinic site) lyase n=1 Tax=Humibacter albus TaxID=427754 RepID=UPI0003B4EC19|nr:bifunctional DNA-formamidopyrimidine glycosylase/DNA-(apurinic or apyrimidinic site) lyase [Humibacter albus]
MPELPEVEVVRAGLAPAITGATLTGVEVLDERALTRHERARGDFAALLTGRRMLGAARRGKFLWVPLEASDRAREKAAGALPGPVPGAASDVLSRPAESASSDAILLHLGMSGQVLLREPGAPLEPHARVRLTVEHPEHGELAVHFVDQRTFGSLAVDALVTTPDGAAGGFGVDLASVPSQVAHIARDPLDPAFDDDRFFASLRARRTTVKRALLDQTLISGVGNIYADEALWAARVHFDQPTSSLSARKARELLAEARAVLQKALVEGGTSFDAQYVNVNGQGGYFAHSLNAYGRQGLPCPRCGTAMVRATFMNRSSHYCPRCQRVRRPRRS